MLYEQSTEAKREQEDWRRNKLGVERVAKIETQSRRLKKGEKQLWKLLIMKEVQKASNNYASQSIRMNRATEGCSDEEILLHTSS